MKKIINKKIFQTKNKFFNEYIYKPRLSVTKSNNHIYAQIIDDNLGFTLCFSSTLKKSLFEKKISKATKIEAYYVGKDIGYQALQKGIKFVKFDRRCHSYHGLIKALAQGARKTGLFF